MGGQWRVCLIGKVMFEHSLRNEQQCVPGRWNSECRGFLSAWQDLVAGKGIIGTIFRKKYLEQMHIDE